MADTTTVLDNIRTALYRRRITQQTAAQALGMTQPALSARLSGKTGLDVTELLALADLLDVDPAALLKESA